MPTRGRAARVRAWAVVMGISGALALGTGCGLKDKVTGDDDKDTKAQSTGSAAPEGGAPPAAPSPAGRTPDAPTAPGGGGSPAAPKGGAVEPPEVCAVLPTDAVSAVLKATVVAQKDSVPFSCDFRADGKSVLSTSRTLNTVFKPGDDTAPIEKAVTEEGGIRLDDQVGAPAALSTDGRHQKLVLTVKVDDKNFLKVTISPAGTAKDLDQAGMVALAKAVVAAAR
ncbi:hypothetical protein LO772_02080 [Yinghuangia sp. ASG 101]|uniref:hypothetical protein n=1 Tax=Yinghuangia sp. ASG 101 TaxID=2896848 RepID=UPI001E373431|nr:hypothetical protein [Yinghuangia sp. ASG 101]UGQ12426.1 hypothetical protein LO772_02080 [Yinghuangia sp. ASG 101]